jgi:hypothetical protein
MPDSCTCGAQLQPDSLFCHKCGKPLREIIIPETAAPEPPAFVPPLPPGVPEPLPLNFHNPVAVRVAFTVALVTTLLSWVPALNIVLWLAAGFFAVLFYRRRTGYLLNVKAGVRMGWITGVLMFAITTVIFTATMVPVAASGGIGTLFRAQFKNATDPNVQEALKLLQSGPGLAVLLVVTLFMLFIFITLLSMAGGALGAKMVGRGN